MPTGSSVESAAVPGAALADLRERLRGALVLPGDAAYDEGRRVWNAMIDKSPGAIARCVDVADVLACVDVARRHDLRVAVRGGGHNVAGNAVCDGGLVIDLARMTGVHVDPARERVRVEPGAVLGDLDHATHPFGLSVPVGIVTATGVGGLTLGGGVGWLQRKYGLTIDNLLSVDVVTADARLLRASADEHDDLFWGVRGGGGNFGVVTSFEFRPRPVSTVLGGALFYAPDDLGDFLRAYREFCADVPDELTADALLLTAPAVPFLPEDVHGRPIG